MEEIINILLNDADLITLLGGEARIFPNYTTETGTAIVYTFNTLSNDKCTRHLRLKITIIAPDLPRCEQIEARLCELLLTLGDEPLTWNILQCVANGGGDLYDTDRAMNHHIIYFDIITRSVKL